MTPTAVAGEHDAMIPRCPSFVGRVTISPARCRTSTSFARCRRLGGTSSVGRMRLTKVLGLSAVLLVPAALLAFPSLAQAATVSLYVDRTSSACSDSGPGTAAAPYCTITKGVSRLAAG